MIARCSPRTRRRLALGLIASLATGAGTPALAGGGHAHDDGCEHEHAAAGERDDAPALFDCPHDGCDCGPAIGQAELMALLQRTGGQGADADAAQRELRTRGGRAVEALVAHYPTLPPDGKIAALREAGWFRRHSRILVRVAWLDGSMDQPEIREAVVRLAALVREPVVLLELADSPEASDRREAATGLAGVPAATERLEALLLSDSDPGTRAAAARALNREHHVTALASLVAAAADDSEGEVRRAAAMGVRRHVATGVPLEVRREALRRFRSRQLSAELAPHLSTLLHDAGMYDLEEMAGHEDPAVRRSVIDTLARSYQGFSETQKRRADALLVRGFVDDSPMVRRLAIHLPGQLGARSCAPSLVELLRQRDHPDLPLVVKTLSRLSGQRLPASYPAWRRWVVQEMPEAARVVAPPVGALRVAESETSALSDRP